MASGGPAGVREQVAEIIPGFGVIRPQAQRLPARPPLGAREIAGAVTGQSQREMGFRPRRIQRRYSPCQGTNRRRGAAEGEQRLTFRLVKRRISRIARKAAFT